MTPITIIILAAIGLVVVRQFQAREMRTGPLVAIPLLLIGLGIEAFAGRPPIGALGIALFAANAAVSVGFGAWRGHSERIWRTANGAAWRQGTTATAALWAASIASRLIAVAVARALGDHSPATGQLELLLGLSFAAQHAVLAVRSGATGERRVDRITATPELTV